jgi:hypothetical protein
VQARKRVRTLRGHLLDVDPALLREHEQGLFRTAVEGERQVVLLRDLRRPLDPEPSHHVAADVEPEDLPCLLRGLCRRVGQLDASRLSAAARQDLGLHDNLSAELLGGATSLVRRRRKTAFGNGNAVPLEELLPLVLVEVHRRASLTALEQPPKRLKDQTDSRST